MRVINYIIYRSKQSLVLFCCSLFSATLRFHMLIVKDIRRLKAWKIKRAASCEEVEREMQIVLKV